jgi:aryl-alcohol dehydrogenase-like predicted oxidoreductase
MSQLALVWLLWRSPVVLPIPGTSRVSHLEENIAAATITLDENRLQALTDLVPTRG